MAVMNMRCLDITVAAHLMAAVAVTAKARFN
jgi:hypothetical protein